MNTTIESDILQHCLLPNLTCLHPEISSKRKLLMLIGNILQRELPMLCNRQITSALQAREDIGSTALNNGIAIPHARIKNIDRPFAGLFLLNSPIEYDDDGNQVDIIFTIFAPTNAAAAYSDLLSSAAERLQSKERLKKMRASTTNRELHNAFIQI